MSKPRSRLIDYKNTVYREVHGYTTEIHFGRQAKHMPGQPNFDSTKSPITISITAIQNLVEHRAGTGYFIPNSHKEIVDFATTIGMYYPVNGGRPLPTRYGTVHYSKHGAHVVPANPNQRGRS